MKKISAVLITKNEEHNIERCLNSLKFADEIVVYDTGSTDRTVEICEKNNCVVFKTDKWDGFGIAKRTAVSFASNDWVFVIDADEEVSEALNHYLESFKKNENTLYAYRIKRTSYYLNKRIKYSGWQRDYTLRLFNRKHANFNEKIVHESVVCTTPIGHVKALLLHYPYPHLQIHINKTMLYAKLGGQQAFDKGKKSGVCYAILNGISKFLKMYIFNLGFLDGKEGLILAINSAFSNYLKYVYLWEKREGKNG
ncbi:MAG TPA: glycosyltransferase family 2 protein [Candidatus Cloacimonadota bacterium]|nr:glycosyltransferase family 2 protein [Candidatus Cloacimonadota bacterium]